MLSRQNLTSNGLLHTLVIAASVLVTYFGLWNAFFYTHDDFLWTGIMRHRETIGEAMQGLGNGVRFLNFGMIWTKIQLFDTNATPYLITSMIQHFIVSYLVYRLVDLWTERRLLAFITALIFATKFSYFEIVTSVSASDYSFWAIFYLSSLWLFCAYLKWRKRAFYIGAIAVYAILAFGHDFTLSLPLVIMAYHLTLGRGDRPLRSLGWADLRLHFPFWFFWAIHVAIQFSYIILGTSEAVYSNAEYGPGLHIITNLRFLSSHLMPNIPIYDRIAAINYDLYLATGILSDVIAIGINVAAIFLLWKGSTLVRFAVALIYLPFLQYTMWHSSFAGAPRYLYFSSIGFSLLVALLLFRIYDYLTQREVRPSRWVVGGAFAAFVAFNIVVVQAWVQQNINNGEVRRNFVTRFNAEFQGLGPETLVYIEVPEPKFGDLAYSCGFLFDPAPICESLPTGTLTLDEITAEAEESNYEIYWLTLQEGGVIQQNYPSSVASG